MNSKKKPTEEKKEKKDAKNLFHRLVTQVEADSQNKKGWLGLGV